MVVSSVLVATSDGLHGFGDDADIQLQDHKIIHAARDPSGWSAIVDDPEVWWREGHGWKRVASSKWTPPEQHAGPLAF